MAKDAIRRGFGERDPLVLATQQLNLVQAELAALRTKFVALLVKLDADVGVTDVNYAATQTPAVMTSEVITWQGVAPA